MLTGDNKNDDFTLDQMRFITARLESKTDKEAAAKIGFKPVAVSKWPNKKDIDAYIKSITNDRQKATIRAIEQAGLKATMTMIKLLNSEDEGMRFKASQEIIRQNIGNPKQKQEITGGEGGALEVVIKYADD